MVENTKNENQLHHIDHLVNTLLPQEKLEVDSTAEKPVENKDLHEFFLNKNKDAEAKIFNDLEKMP